MSFDSLDNLGEKRNRGLLRLVPYALGLLYLLAAIAANAWLWLGVELGPAAAVPKLEFDPPAPDPQVLHRAALLLPTGPFAAPYQAGRYEIDRVLPVELTVVYRRGEPGDLARAALFVEPLADRWRLLAPAPAARALANDWTAARLLAALQAGARPSLGERLAPWRLWRWVGRRQWQRRILAEDGGGEWRRLWRLTRGRAVVVGREYGRGAKPGLRVAATCFLDGRALDLRFVFTRVNEDNAALVRAWIDGLLLPLAKKPDNLAGLAACEGLPTAEPNEPAIRLCRQLHLLAAWHMQKRDPNVAAQLVDLYAYAKDARGLRTLAAQLALEPDDAATRASRERVAKFLTALAREPAAADEAADKPDEENDGPRS
jgi:hypothetical protein